MSTSVTDVYWDPWDREIYESPFALYRQLRDDAPLYHNDRHGFYAISRYEDVERMLQDRDTFISGKGAILDAMLANTPIPPGLFIFEDPPFHTFHRARLSRVFTPRAVSQLEDDVHEFCARTLDALAGRERFDMMGDLAREVPMRVMGLLLGIPESDQPRAPRPLHRVHAPTHGDGAGSHLRERPSPTYIDWREEHPSDDLMTRLLLTEFEDETGTTRRLHREELVTYINLIAAAGNDTTGLLIGWIGKLLSDHPDQRAEIARGPVADPGSDRGGAALRAARVLVRAHRGP